MPFLVSCFFTAFLCSLSRFSSVLPVPCKDCECVYIGQTGRTLEKRLSEHKNVKAFSTVLHICGQSISMCT